jgi:hypothetical protein
VETSTHCNPKSVLDGIDNHPNFSKLLSSFFSLYIMYIWQILQGMAARAEKLRSSVNFLARRSMLTG